MKRFVTLLLLAACGKPAEPPSPGAYQKALDTLSSIVDRVTLENFSKMHDELHDAEHLIDDLPGLAEKAGLT